MTANGLPEITQDERRTLVKLLDNSILKVQSGTIQAFDNILQTPVDVDDFYILLKKLKAGGTYRILTDEEANTLIKSIGEKTQ